jgi:hypothetical protein
MLRITHAQTEEGQRWKLCGQLTGPWVAELRACWEYHRQAGASGRAVVDLRDVTSIDESGEELLSEMRRAGAELAAAGVYTQHLLENPTVRGERAVRFIAPRAFCCEKPEVSKNRGDK